MKTLLILRHAKSSWENSGLADHDRPLNKRGKRDAPRMGLLLREQGLAPDLILSSTAKRARRTASAVAESAEFQGEVKLLPELYHAGPRTYSEVLRNISNDCESVMVVGHNPGLEILLAKLAGEGERLPTASLAHLQLGIDSWGEFNLDVEARLVGLWRPRELA